MRRKRPTPAMVVALCALVVALGGTAVAASRYIITSTSQIKPRVVRNIGRQARIERLSQISPQVLQALATRTSSVILRARSVGPVQTASDQPASRVQGRAPIPLRPATWTQAADQINQFVGEWSVNVPSTAECEPTGTRRGSVRLGVSFTPKVEAFQASVPFQAQPHTYAETFTLLPLYEPGRATTRTLEVTTADTCTTGKHATVNSVAIDVIGIK